MNKKESMPELTEGIWYWKNTGGAWGSSMSVDGHIFKTKDIKPILKRIGFDYPNLMETGMKKNHIHKAKMICFDKGSKIFNIPLNKVQKYNNRFGKVSSEYLNNEFLKNKRISMSNIRNIENNSVHQEIDINFEGITYA